MGYFNYFIKCVIRKFVNMLFKPKMFLALLIIIGLLFAMQITSRAEWTDIQIQQTIEDLESIASTNYYMYKELEDISTFAEWISADVVILRNTLYEVNTKIDSLNTSVANIESELNSIVSQLQSVNTSISNIYNKLEENHEELIEKLDENQQQLLAELDEDNQAVLEELNMIRDAINGSEEEPTTFDESSLIYSSNSSFYIKRITLDYESNYTYDLELTLKNISEANESRYLRVFETDNLITSGFNESDYKSNFVIVENIPANVTDYIVNYTVSSDKPKYVYFALWYPLNITEVKAFRSIKGITESLNDSNSLQQQQNQLQQQQNQLQQEQNDFLSKPSEDSDVSVDSFNNVDSNDITSSGLSGVFNTIYNSITSWNAKNINLPIPYTNKSITIPANYTESMLTNFGGSWVINFIHAVYYFIVGRFMIYSITNIINSIKGGSILETDSKNNITTDML